MSENRNIPGELQLASVDDLIDELGTRCIGLLVVTERLRPGPADHRQSYEAQVRWRGCGPIGAVGLAEFAKDDVLRSINGKGRGGATREREV